MSPQSLLQKVRTFVANGKIFADNFPNFSANPFRRVDLEAQLDHSVNVSRAVELLKHRLQGSPNVTIKTVPAEVLKSSPMGPVLAVRPYTNNHHYWQVYFVTNRTIRETFTEAGFPVAEQHLTVMNGSLGERGNGHSAAATN